MSRSLAQRLHNPRGHRCGCSPQCWCQRRSWGRLLRWYLPKRHHSVSPQWKLELAQRAEGSQDA